MLMRKVTNGNAIDNYTCPLFQQAHLLLLQHSWFGPDSRSEHAPPAAYIIKLFRFVREKACWCQEFETIDEGRK